MPRDMQAPTALAATASDRRDQILALSQVLHGAPAAINKTAASQREWRGFRGSDGHLMPEELTFVVGRWLRSIVMMLDVVRRLSLATDI